MLHQRTAGPNVESLGSGLLLNLSPLADLSDCSAHFNSSRRAYELQQALPPWLMNNPPSSALHQLSKDSVSRCPKINLPVVLQFVCLLFTFK